MNERIALGFQTCVDYELVWDTEVIENTIKKFGICADELNSNIDVDSERDVWIASLANLSEGVGCEIIPNNSEICQQFASRFEYRVTLGGTPTRAAIVLDMLGFSSILQTSCDNIHVRTLLPSSINVLSGARTKEEVIYPHVVLQCAKGVRIQANDIDFITPRENRILISRDEDSLNMEVLEKKFGTLIEGVEVLLIGSFTQIMDYDVLKDRVKKTKRLLMGLKESTVVVMEDGCYIKPKFRKYVHAQLSEYIDILSMNEDELQQFIKRKIDLLNVHQVRNAIDIVYQSIGVKNVLVHTSDWALLYGNNAIQYKECLVGGIAMAGTRFRLGDNCKRSDYEQTKMLKDKQHAYEFSRELVKGLENKLSCIPCKDLSYVKIPTVVGLGDSFIGGALPHLLNDK